VATVTKEIVDANLSIPVALFQHFIKLVYITAHHISPGLFISGKLTPLKGISIQFSHQKQYLLPIQTVHFEA